MKNWKKILIVILICLVGLVLRFKVFPYKTHWSDMFFWKDWGSGILEYGTKKFYSQFGADYLPFYPLVLGLVQKTYNLTRGWLSIKDIYFFKFPAMVADVVLGLFIFQFLKEIKNYKAGILGMFLFLFNPAVFANSSMWGQVDVVGTLFLFAGYYYLYKKNYWVSGVMLSLALATKALYLIAVPFLLLFFFVRQKGFKNTKIIKKYLLLGAGAVFALVIVTLPFVNGGFLAVFKFLFERYKIISQRYPYTSVNAFNFWGLIDKKFWMSDQRKFLQLFYYQWGNIITLALITLIYLKGILTTNIKKWFYNLNLGTSLLFASSFLFLTRMHERHFFYVFPFLAVASVIRRRLTLGYLLISLTYLLNLYFGLEYYYQAKTYVFTSLQINLFSAVNLIVFLWLLIEFLFLNKNEA